jgi:osmoprotectant transport system permease protein
VSAWGEFVDYVTLADNWWGRRGIATRIEDHVTISVVATAAAAALAVPPALWLGHIRRGGAVATAVVNVGRAVPSFAIVALALPISLRYGFGLGFWPTVVALVALALPPIFTNTYAGVAGIDPAVSDAARGMGMRGGEVLWRVEVPNALPLLLTGMRISAVQVVATATLGALVGYRNLGTPIVSGFTSPNKGPLLAGAIAVALLALITDAFFVVADRRLVPWRRTRRTADVAVAPEAVPGPAPG